MASESQICPNCNKPVSIFNFTIHVLHCQRNLSLCELCNEVVPVNDIENHLQTAHKIVKCPLCNEEFENFKVEDHQAFCTKRLVQCIYCELEVPCDTLTEHEDYCGSRTEKCVECNQYVRIRDNETHKAALHPSHESTLIKVEDHQEFCTKRLVQCIYCELEVPCDTLDEHEDYCGSRTEKCVDCNEYVRIRDNETHKAARHPSHESLGTLRSSKVPCILS